MFHCHSPSHPARHNRGDCFSVTAPHTLRAPAPLSSRGTVNSTREHCAGLLVMTCIAMQPVITSCCYEGMRMLHAHMRYGLRNCGDRETGQLASAPPPRAGPARRRPRPIPQPRARELPSAGRRGAAGKWRAKPSCGFSTLFSHSSPTCCHGLQHSPAPAFAVLAGCVPVLCKLPVFQEEEGKA